MKYILILLIITCIYQTSQSQSLTPERVNKIKNCTVRISFENSNNTGSGFIVGNNGMVITCWHVISQSLHWDSTGKLIKADKIFIKLNSGETIIYGVSIDLLNDDWTNAVTHDFCILFPVKTQSKIFNHLKIGDFNNIKEGEEVYTCGYPFSINQQFISKGILSTKYQDTISYGDALGNHVIVRNVALLDLTLNKGNSGGPIIRLSKNIEDDEVVGIADFIINPLLNHGEEIIKYLDSRSGGVMLSGVDPIKVLSGVTTILNDTSDGISGCVSINYYLDDLLVKKK